MAKLCPTCGNTISEKNYCSHCDHTIHSYEKIKNASKVLYNEGLMQAKERDLSGAIQSLTRSIRYDKTNIDAMNLLGLIYFEIGETVLAIRQWVLSQHLKTNGNIASEYLNKIRDNQVNLDKLNQAINKYNQSIHYIEQNSKDLAIINLKKVVNLHPKFLKAYNLLGLLYMEEGQYEKAKKELVKVLQYDRSNHTARKYLEAMNGAMDETDILLADGLGEDHTKKATNLKTTDVFKVFGGIIAGSVVGAVLLFFLYLPGQLSQKDTLIATEKATVVEITEDLEQAKSTLQENKNRISSLEADLQQAISDKEQAQISSVVAMNLLQISEMYVDGNIEGAGDKLLEIQETSITDSRVKVIYTTMKETILDELAEKYYIEGYNQYTNRKNYTRALEAFERSVKYSLTNERSDDAVYYLARSYQILQNETEAVRWFEYLITTYENSDKIAYAKDRLSRLD